MLRIDMYALFEKTIQGDGNCQVALQSPARAFANSTVRSNCHY
jgi:hypothetical protein